MPQISSEFRQLLDFFSIITFDSAKKYTIANIFKLFFVSYLFYLFFSYLFYILKLALISCLGKMASMLSSLVWLSLSPSWLLVLSCADYVYEL